MVITRPVLTAVVISLVGSCGLFAKAAPVKASIASKPKIVAAKPHTIAAKPRTTTKKAAFPARRTAVARTPSAQASPNPDRLREVQQALLDRGYMTSAPTGQWDANSIVALKRFESDQKVKIDGRIDSKMLIALGLGPKYDSSINLPGPGATGALVSADLQGNDQQR